MSLSWKIHWHQIIIGLLIGFFLGSLYTQSQVRERFGPPWKKGNMKQFMVQKFSKELNLTPDQKTKVEAVFDTFHPKMMALRDEMRPKFEALHNSAKEEIRKILNPDQQKKFETMNQQMEERWKKHREAFEGNQG